MSDEVEVEEAEAESGAPVEQLKKNATPVVTVILALLLGGGAGAGSGLLGGGADDADECRAMVSAHAADVTKARAAEWENHRRDEANLYASQSDVAGLSVKMDMVWETVREIRDDLRDSRRGRGRPAP